MNTSNKKPEQNRLFYTPEEGWQTSIASRDSQVPPNPRKDFDTEDENDLRSNPNNFEEYDENDEAEDSIRTPGL